MNRTPWVTYSIVGADVLVFLAMLVSLGTNAFSPSTEDLLKFGADHGPHTSLQGQYWRVLSSMFVHAGPLHLLFNMYVLWSVGPVAEFLFGRWRYLGLYVLAGVGSCLGSLWWNPAVVSVGASGAIFGIFGGLLAYFQQHREQYDPQMLQKHFKSIFAFVGYNVAFGLAVPGIDNAAHIGGLCGGLLAGFALAPQWQNSRRFPARQVAALLVLAAIFGLASVKLRWRVEHCPAVISQGKAVAYNDYIRRVKPLMDAGGSLGSAVMHEFAQPSESSQAQAHVEAARVNLASLRQMAVSDPDVAEMHAILIARAEALLALAEASAQKPEARSTAAVAALVSRCSKCADELLEKRTRFFSRYHLSHAH